MDPRDSEARSAPLLGTLMMLDGAAARQESDFTRSSALIGARISEGGGNARARWSSGGGRGCRDRSRGRSGGAREADWAAGRNRKPAAKVIYAFVRGDDGVLIRDKGATVAKRTSTGAYDVTFDRPIAQCTWVATPIDLGPATTVDSNDTNTGEVDTFTTAGVAADRPFSLQVAC